MKKVLLSLSAVLLMFSCEGNIGAVEAKDAVSHTDHSEVNAEMMTELYTIDASGSAVKWEGKKLAYGHHGVITIKTGEVKVRENSIVSANVSIDMSTIEETDFQDKEDADKLAGRLKSADFFNVDSFPTADVLVTKVEEGKVFADLTIKGITKAIEFPAIISLSDSEVNVTAKFTIDRTDWGVIYGSGSFMDLAKDKAIDDLISFDIDIDLVAKK